MYSDFVTILLNSLECALKETRRQAKMHQAAVELLETLVDVLCEDAEPFDFIFDPEDEYDD